MIALLLKEVAFTVLLNLALNTFTIDIDYSHDIDNGNFKGIEDLNFKDDPLEDLPDPEEGLVEAFPLETL